MLETTSTFVSVNLLEEILINLLIIYVCVSAQVLLKYVIALHRWLVVCQVQPKIQSALA